jgi:tetratricopeptide (TPR) repeat protein
LFEAASEPIQHIPVALRRKLSMATPIHAFVLVAFLLISPIQSVCQASARTEARVETAKDLDARLTASQRQQFEAAKKARQAGRNQEALAGFKILLQEVPGDSLLEKYAGDAAIEVGDSAYAADLLRPVVQTNFEDWQAVSMLARAAAESGDKQTRDAAMVNMTMLRQHGLNLPQYVLERIATGQNVMTIACFLIPAAPYKASYVGRVADAKGLIFLRVALESSDTDQLLFAKEHPKEAAAGLRQFTLDAYQETGLNSAGQRTQSHFTYKFFTGQPPYDAVREEFLNVANGKTKPISSRTGLIVP